MPPPQDGSEDAPSPAGDPPGIQLLGFVKAGAIVGWDMGGVGSLGILVGGPADHIHLAVRAMAGMSVGHSDPSLAGGAEVGYRKIWPLHPKFRLTLLVAASYLFRRARTPQTDMEYLYNIPQGHLYGGILFGRKGRLSHGLELGGGAGYAFHMNPQPDSKDYSGFYGGAELSYLLTF